MSDEDEDIYLGEDLDGKEFDVPPARRDRSPGSVDGKAPPPMPRPVRGPRRTPSPAPVTRNPVPAPVSAPVPQAPRAPEAGQGTVLIVGRQASGKSVFIASLFRQLDGHKANVWERHAMRLFSRDLRGSAGQVRYKGLLEHVKLLESNCWPKATAEWAEFDFEVEHPLGRSAVKYVDYPGEVFSRAFFEGIDDQYTERLRGELASASHVVLLIDVAQILVKLDRPENGNRQEERDHNTQGMRELVRVIRDMDRANGRAGSAQIPISIVLTKGDSNRVVLAAASCLADSGQSPQPREDMLAKLIPSVLESARPVVEVDIVTAVAVRSAPGPDGSLSTIPDVEPPPVNLVEAFKRVIHWQLLQDLRAAAMQPDPDPVRLGSLLSSADRCRLDPAHFSQVRLAKNRARQAGIRISSMTGARLASLARQLQDLVPDVDVDDLLASLRSEVSQRGRSGSQAESAP